MIKLEELVIASQVGAVRFHIASQYVKEDKKQFDLMIERKTKSGRLSKYSFNFNKPDAKNNSNYDIVENSNLKGFTPRVVAWNIDNMKIFDIDFLEFYELETLEVKKDKITKIKVLDIHLKFRKGF